MPMAIGKCKVCGKEFEYFWNGGRAGRATCDPPYRKGGCWAARRKAQQKEYAKNHKDQILKNKRARRKRMRGFVEKPRIIKKRSKDFLSTNKYYQKEAFVNPHHRAATPTVRTISI